MNFNIYFMGRGHFPYLKFFEGEFIFFREGEAFVFGRGEFSVAAVYRAGNFPGGNILSGYIF